MQTTTNQAMIMSGWEKRSSEVPPSDKTPPIHSTSSTSTHVLNIDDLPDFLLVEILCRLPSKEFVFQCKCVSKHWLNLVSDPYLIGRFLHLQRFHKQTPIACSLIDRKGEEFPTPRTPQSSSNLLAPLFKRLMSFHGLEQKPYVVRTSNDLVLCCRTKHDQRDFYICNPCTRQWIALPPTTRCCTHAPVGFICDRYYEDATSVTNSTVNIKKDYRCKVVRILPHDLSTMYFCSRFSKFIVEVFSFETGEWRESIVSSPRNINIRDTSVAYNGMLYWTYTASKPREETGLIRLDPFVIGNIGSASSGRPNGDETVDDDQYRFRLFDAVENLLDRPWICVRQGRLQMWAYYHWDYNFIVWELTGNDDLGSADKLYLKELSVYPVTSKVLEYDDGAVLLALDPNDEDIVYVKSFPICCFMYNIRRRRWSKVASTKYFEELWSDHHLFRLVLPWWPTPLRRLPMVEELPI